MKKLTTDRWQSGRIPGVFGAAFKIWVCYTLLGFGLTEPAQAAVYPVTTNAPSGPGSLSNALAQAQSDSAAVINLQTNLGVITLAGMLPQIENNLVLNGNSNTISGANSNRIFFVNARFGTVLIDSLTLEKGSALGGAGGIGTGGGGGGGGLGGAIFLNSGNLTVSNLVFSANSATGGTGGLGWQFTDTPAGGGGGGGGLNFNGGNAFGGSIDGGMTYQGPGGGGGALTSAGANGTAATPTGGNGGGLNGGLGGANQLVSGNAGNGGSPVSPDGGGGGGGLNLTTGNGGDGGNGSDFGGGGGAGSSDLGNSGFSGEGGFGGGGGGGAYSTNGVANPGADGGFGGGGGGGGGIEFLQNGQIGNGGNGGFGAGNGVLVRGNTPLGGGGLGAGGAIFARLGTTLSVEDCSFAADTVFSGNVEGSPSGSAIGAALFLGGNLTYSVSSGTNVLTESIGGGNDPNAEGSLTKTGAGTLVLTATNSFVGNTTVSAGTLRILNNVLGSPAIIINSNAVFEYDDTNELAEAPTTYVGAGTLRISGSGEVVFGPGAINVDFSPGALIDVQGGKLFGSSGFAGIWTANQSSLNIAASAEFDAVEAGPSGTMQMDALTGAGTFLGGYSGNNGALTTVTIGVAGGGGTFSGTLQDEVSSHLGLIKTGAGIEVFSGNNTYTGGTTVNAGTLDINGNNGPGYVIASGGTLGGTGTIGGPVSIGSAATLSPGAPVGTLTINNNLSLAGNTLVVLNAATNSRVAGLASVTFGGTLTITNLGGPLVFGSHYPLFSAATTFGNFTSIVGNPGPGLAYAFNPTNGILSVLPTLPTAPTNLVYHTSSGQIQLSWPANYTGWILQTQTNPLSVGLGTNWVDVPNSALVDATNILLSPDNSVFFRLRYP